MYQFTAAKQKVRELNLTVVRNYITPPWRYLGLPSVQMEDVELFKPFLSCVHAIERGIFGQEWKTQHDLAVTALLRGYPDFRLFRGDIDAIILAGKDSSEQRLEWPYHVINLDYTGGIIYKEAPTSRVRAIQKLIEEQGSREASFVLIITVNDKHHDFGEINHTLDDIQIECRGNIDSQKVLDIKNREDRRCAIFLYTTFIVITTGRKWYRVEPYKPILYTGASGYRMVNMSYYFKFVHDRDAPLQGTRLLCKSVELGPIELEDGVE